jgi:hypothetical protein
VPCHPNLDEPRGEEVAGGEKEDRGRDHHAPGRAPESGALPRAGTDRSRAVLDRVDDDVGLGEGGEVGGGPREGPDLRLLHRQVPHLQAPAVPAPDDADARAAQAQLVAVAQPLRGRDGPPAQRDALAASRLRIQLAVVEGEEDGGIVAGQPGDLDVGPGASQREREIGFVDAAGPPLLLDDAGERHRASSQRTSSGAGRPPGETTSVFRVSR